MDIGNHIRNTVYVFPLHVCRGYGHVIFFEMGWKIHKIHRLDPWYLLMDVLKPYGPGKKYHNMS